MTRFITLVVVGFLGYVVTVAVGLAIEGQWHMFGGGL